MSKIDRRRELVRFLKFMVVGAFGALVDFGVMNLLTHFFGLELVPAGTVSFICAVGSNFLWNRYWTYPDSRSRPLLRQLLMFLVVNTAGVVIRIPILWGLEPTLIDLFMSSSLPLIFTAEFLGKNLTLAIAIIIVMLWNFFINRYWTYNDVDKLKQDSSDE